MCHDRAHNTVQRLCDSSLFRLHLVSAAYREGESQRKHRDGKLESGLPCTAQFIQLCDWWLVGKGELLRLKLLPDS